MHGWGDTSLLKLDGYEGTLHPRGVRSKQEGKAPVPVPLRDGRYDLYGVLSGTEAGQPDAWIGNPGLNPRMVRLILQEQSEVKAPCLILAGFSTQVGLFVASSVKGMRRLFTLLSALWKGMWPSIGVGSHMHIH